MVQFLHNGNFLANQEQGVLGFGSLVARDSRVRRIGEVGAYAGRKSEPAGAVAEEARLRPLSEPGLGELLDSLRGAIRSAQFRRPTQIACVGAGYTHIHFQTDLSPGGRHRKSRGQFLL